jgi:DnaK suppressor protein
MDFDLARTRLTTERTDVAQLLAETQTALASDQETEQEPGDFGDAGQPLTSEGVEGAVTEQLTNRLATIDRALARLEDGTYGVSIRSGEKIPDERLDADPAAELTVAEAQDAETAAR